MSTVQQYFDEGLTLQEALKLVVEYWSTLEMEKAIDTARPYYDILTELSKGD